MIIGAHVMLQSTDANADREFLTRVLELPSVDAGGGFLIFGLPPSELAVHESDANNTHGLYLMCADIGAFVTDMRRRRITCTDPVDRGWGKITQLTLPGGGNLEVYQPTYQRPQNPA